jgi:hypothetical protein
MNTINIRDLQKVELRALITVLEYATAHLVLPDEATAALDRLRRLIRP